MLYCKCVSVGPVCTAPVAQTVLAASRLRNSLGGISAATHTAVVRIHGYKEC